MKARCSVLSFLVVLATAFTTPAQLLWTVGLNDNGWPFTAQNPGNGGGPNTSFVQEAGVNPLPGNPNSPEVDRQADDDYYFAGSYATAIDSVIAFYGTYVPIGDVLANEEATERAFAGSDNDERYHFNLPDTMLPTDLLSITFDFNNLDTGGIEDPRYGVEVYFNGVLVQTQIVIRPSQLGLVYTTPQFTLESVNALTGPSFDNIVHLKGINYGGAGGGQWMGIDFVQLNAPTEAIPAPVFPWTVGMDDGGWPFNAMTPGNGGGSNATFVAETGVNPLPGNPASPEVDRQADDDYYFAGLYTNTIPSVVAAYGPYTPVGLVPVNEEAVERAFAGDDNDLRYHFNLPNHLTPSDRVAVSFDAINLDDPSPVNTDRRYGVEVYFNGVLVQPEIVIRPPQFNQTIKTPSFTLGSVNARVGSGFDNIVHLKGINYGNDGGGQWMGIDYVALDISTNSVPPPTFPLQIGMDDDSWPVGDGGGTNATFVAGNGTANPLPGVPNNEEFEGDADDDYYFGGAYTSTIPGNGNYEPVGLVFVNEEAAARGFAGADNELRYHFNLPADLSTNDTISVTFDALTLGTGADPRYGVEVLFNGVLVQTQIIIRPAQLGLPITTAAFSVGSVDGRVGPGFDNILTLRGISYNAQGGGDSLGFDYVRLAPNPRITFPWMVGRDDNDHRRSGGAGGGTNATFWQENGAINPLPGRPNNPEVDRQNDNDYYFSGVYTNTIESVVTLYGPYTPVGTVLANERGAERAFAAADNDLRYHFNLPSTLQPTDVLTVTFDPLNLDTDNGGVPPFPSDPRYGVEVYFNGVLVQTQLVIRPSGLNVPYTSPEFTLASVNAQTGLGFDNIVSLKGINYSGDGGGNWMGVDYVQLNHIQAVELRFLPPSVTGGQITLDWTGGGALESAPAITGPWTELSGATTPYSEAVVPGQMRFYRLRSP